MDCPPDPACDADTIATAAFLDDALPIVRGNVQPSVPAHDAARRALR